jgi:predicted KAP-like P-loop ATPase
MVDELDRCRPDYAIRVLERIKHFFDISGIVFIIGMDRNQLCHSICGLYGERFNSSEYLKKFIRPLARIKLDVPLGS